MLVLQGGAGVEVFSAQGKDPVAKWKLCGGQSAIRKVRKDIFLAGAIGLVYLR